MSKIDHSLFNAPARALEDAYGVCPQCDAALRIRNSKKGRFLGCSRYPDCEFSKPLQDTETFELKLIDGSHCPECDNPLAIKKGRYGLFIGCSQFPACHHIEAVKQQAQTQLSCPLCKKGNLVQRTNKFGKSFFACDGYPKCKYLLNGKPVAHLCPACAWPIMLERGAEGDRYLQCPQRQCQKKVNLR